MKVKVTVVIILLVCLIVWILYSGKSNDIEGLVELKEWHQEWEELFWQGCDADYYSMGIPECEATFDQLISDLEEINAIDVLEYNSYLYAHQIFITEARNMYIMQEQEGKWYASQGWDEIPGCPQADYGVQEHNPAYLSTCSDYFLAQHNLNHVRIQFEIKYIQGYQ